MIPINNSWIEQHVQCLEKEMLRANLIMINNKVVNNLDQDLLQYIGKYVHLDQVKVCKNKKKEGTKETTVLQYFQEMDKRRNIIPPPTNVSSLLSLLPGQDENNNGSTRLSNTLPPKNHYHFFQSRDQQDKPLWIQYHFKSLIDLSFLPCCVICQARKQRKDFYVRSIGKLQVLQNHSLIYFVADHVEVLEKEEEKNQLVYFNLTISDPGNTLIEEEEDTDEEENLISKKRKRKVIVEDDDDDIGTEELNKSDIQMSKYKKIAQEEGMNEMSCSIYEILCILNQNQNKYRDGVSKEHIYEEITTSKTIYIDEKPTLEMMEICLQSLKEVYLIWTGNDILYQPTNT